MSVLSSPSWGINGECISVNLALEGADGRVCWFASDLGENRIGVKEVTGHGRGSRHRRRVRRVGRGRRVARAEVRCR